MAGYSPNLAEEILADKPGAKAFDAAQVAKEMSTDHVRSATQLLEADFDPNTTASVGLRMYLARGDNLAEKQARIKKRYPDGEIDVLPESKVLGFDEDTLVWRENPQSQWKMVDPQGFDWGDIPEAIAGSAESIVGETALAIGSGGASVPATVARQAAGALVGEAVEQGGQYVTGTQKQSPSEVAGEIGAEGAYSAVGGFAVSPLVATKNIVTGRGALRVGDEGLETIRAAGDLDAALKSGLTPALVTDNPAVRLSEAQSAALLPGLQRRYRYLADKLNSVIGGKVDRFSLGNAMTEVQNGLEKMSDHVLSQVSTNGTSMSKGGAALKAGVAKYSEASRLLVQDLYKAAREIEEPLFDMKPVLDLAGDLRNGVKGTIDPKVDAQIKLLESVQGPIQLSDGSALSVTDQIRNVRTELGALAHVEPGQVANQANGQANDMLKAVNGVLKDPTNANPAFRTAWQKANDAASLRFSTLEKAPIIAAAKSQNPADLVKTYARPHQSDNLLAIRNTVSANKWAEFTDSFAVELLNDPASLTKALNKFDQETLDVLIPRAEQGVWKKMATDLGRIANIGAPEIAEQQITNKNFINTLIETATPRKVHTLMRAANLGNNKPMRDSFRAAVVDWTWDGIVTHGKNTLNVNRKLLVSRIESLKEKGLWQYLSAADKKMLGNAEIVSRAFGSVADAGTSIQAASQVAGLKRLQSQAIMAFVRSGLLAQFYLSPIGRKMLIGEGLPNSNGAMIRLLGGSLAQISAPEDLSTLDTE